MLATIIKSKIATETTLNIIEIEPDILAEAINKCIILKKESKCMQ